MNFFDYIGVSPEVFVRDYLKTGLVTMQTHNDFPLAIYCYGRKAVHDNVWDNVTSKCRGIVVNQNNDDVVARPFEKFHNHGSPQAGNVVWTREPYIWEKLDGFMCTMYRWEGKDYIASKGSFHSIHAKWATQWYRTHIGETGQWPAGYTPVFEGLHRDLRIVVDYGTREGLVLLALIHDNTGHEINPAFLNMWADRNKVEVPTRIDMTLERAREESLKQYRDGLGTEEGYVLTWYPTDRYQPPVRLKMKFVDYLRLHRMVCGVTPWRVWEALSTDNGQITEWLDSQNATPWFEQFVNKWVKALTFAYHNHYDEALERFEVTKDKLGVRPSAETARIHSIRRAFAQEFTRPENKEFSSALFKMLDKKDPSPVIWKSVESMTKNGTPCRDPQFLRRKPCP
jgi:RNA ligase